MPARPLRIDWVVTGDDVHPPIARALERAAVKLDHEVVDRKPSLHREVIAVRDEFYTVDGGEDSGARF